MAPERVTVTVQSSIGEGANLTVTDAMRQILDYFDLLKLAGGAEGDLIDWEVVAITLNSPLTVTAQAVAKKPGVDAIAIARREKVNVATAFASIAKERHVPDWMGSDARRKTIEFLTRNTNGVGRTDIVLFENSPPVIIAPTFARVALRAIDSYEKSLVPAIQEIDHSRHEYGSIEANLVSLTSHHGRPALQVKERITRQDVTCVLQPDVADRIGGSHSWNEIWSGRRALISGQLRFRKDGKFQLVTAEEIELVATSRVEFGDIADPEFTGHLSVTEYLDSIWEE